MPYMIIQMQLAEGIGYLYFWTLQRHIIVPYMIIQMQLAEAIEYIKLKDFIKAQNNAIKYLSVAVT